MMSGTKKQSELTRGALSTSGFTASAWCSFIALAAWLGFTPPSHAARETRPVPDGARVALVFSGGTNFVLGEVIEMTFVLSNASPQPFQYETGGDYRGTGFPTRFKFTVLDDSGKALPQETWMNMGGLAGARDLKPGEAYTQSLRLQNYVRVERPGDFTVRVVHDFGWTPAVGQTLPVAVARLIIQLPTPEQAQELVNTAARNQPALRDNELGAYWNQTPFRYLIHPVFLPALEKQAAAGQVSALEGIQRMQNTNATLALLRLLSSDKPDIVHGAALFLGRRMPPRVVDGYPRRPLGPFWSEPSEAETNLWLAEAASPLRLCAGKLLRSTNVSYVKTGAYIIEALGTPEDGALVLEALHATLQEWKVRDKPEDNILNAPGAGDALIAALAGLRERGYRAPQNGGVAVIMAQFLELADPKIPRRAGWEQTLEAFFSQNPPMLREAAVQALPKPPAGKWAELLQGALNDQDRGVMRQACLAAGASSNTAFVVPLANIVRTERQKWVVTEASEALTKLGAHWAATEAWIERMSDEELWFDALSFLAQKLEHPKASGGASGNRPPRESRVALRQKWQQFFADKQRQALVQAGMPVPVTDEQARELFNGAFQLSLEGGKSWPK